MENNEETKTNMESTAESVEKVETPRVEENKEKTFTRDEVNKMINAEKQKERQAILEEMEAKKAEADKLAKMDEDQKKSYELEQERARANKAENELNAYRLKDETIRQASQRGISLGYIETIDFSRETAESINFTIDNNGTVVQKVVMYDELLPVKKVKTGDNSHYEYYMMLAGLAVVVFGMVYFRKKHA